MKSLKSNVLIFGLCAILVACGGGKTKQEKLAIEKQKEMIDAMPKTSAIDVLWKRDLGEFNDVGFEVVIDQGIAYSIDAEGVITAVDIETGKRQWKRKTKNEISAGIGVGRQALFAVDQKARLVAFEREGGKQLWRTDLDNEVLIPPVVADAVVILKTLDARLIGFSVETGEKLWTYRHTKPGLSLRGGSTPVLERNFIFTGFADGRLVAVDSLTGNLLWNVTVGNASGRNEIQRLTDIDAKPIIRGSELYVSAFQRRTMALDMNAGSVLWTRPFSSFHDMAIDGQAIYLIDADNKVIAFNRNNGNVAWAIEEFDQLNFTSISVLGDRLLVTNDDGLALVIDRASGDIIGRQKFSGDSPVAAPMIYQGVAYILTADGELQAWTVN